MLFRSPSFLLKLIEYAENNGIDYNASSIKKAICIGENLRNPDFTLSTLGRRIHEKWHVPMLLSTYASTEMQASFTECEQQHGGHLQPELIITEFLDENGKPVAEGEPGEVTITTLGVMGMPLLRFRTGDICSYYSSLCACERNTIWLTPLVGRKGQLIKFKGTSLYPPALYDLLDNIPQIKDYIIDVYTNDLGTDEIVVRVGCDHPSEKFEKELKDLFRSRVRVAPTIQFASPEYIAKLKYPETSRKAVKFVDLR